MNRKIIILVLFFGVVFAEDCQQYFESRKGELEIQAREFDEVRQALEIFKAPFESLQKEKMDVLNRKEAEVNATLAKTESLREENERLSKQNEEVLNSINNKTEDRIKEIYSQMEDTAVADVLSQMDTEETNKIMLPLESRKISGILSKMDPQKASELALLLQNLDEKEEYKSNNTVENNTSN